MSDVVVVVVGPKAVSGPGIVDHELAAAALDGIDDDHALVDDRIVSVDELWRDVLCSAVGGACDGVVLVCPSWWAAARVDRVVAAMSQYSGRVAVRRRVDVLAVAPAVVEVGPEIVVVHADGQRRAIARISLAGGVLDAIVACVEGLRAVTVDVPAGLAIVGAEVAQVLRRRAIDVTVVDDRDIVRAARVQPPQGNTISTLRRIATPRVAAVVVAVVSVTALSAAALAVRGPTTDVGDVTWLVEGRIAVEVPAQWTVERITSGPGSARVQVVSPTDGTAAIHVTQSGVSSTQTLQETAETLRDALAEEPDGIFVDFTASEERARRPAVTYREIRADRRIDWTVLLDGGVRIAIGCQGPAMRPGPDQQCDRAVRSAHAVA